VTKPVKEQAALIQAWVPKPLQAWIKAEAKKHGLTVASWLRSTLIAMKDETR
jgi:hypothetical protein